jgi:hypothetical protein
VIPLLEQMARLTVLAMYLACVLTGESLHEPAHWQIRNLYSEVNRVFGPIERVHARSAADDHRSQKLLECRVVAGISENRLSRITALNDVVQPTWDVQSRSA